jgi:hypothetical protein
MYPTFAQSFPNCCRDRIAGVELAFSVRIIAKGRRHERDCGAGCENGRLASLWLHCLSGLEASAYLFRPLLQDGR